MTRINLIYKEHFGFVSCHKNIVRIIDYFFNCGDYVTKSSLTIVTEKFKFRIATFINLY